jgi:polysaccharide transporter, PST family
MKSELRNVLDRRIVQNASAMYGAQFANYLLPLVMIPYLARVLGPETWGLVVFIQAIGMYLMLVVDYSFELSATREVARNQQDTSRLSAIVAGVLGARLTLAIAGALVLGVAQLLVPTLREIGWLLWLGIAWYVALALRPFWFFLGMERVRSIVGAEVAAKAAAVAGIVLLVNAPGDAWMVFAFQGAGTMFAVIFGMVLMYRIIPFQLPVWTTTSSALSDGWHMFVFKASNSIYAMSNAIILGFVAPTLAVGYYAGAQRISGILLAGMMPLIQTIFPRVSSVAKDDPPAAARIAKTTMAAFFALASIGAIALYFLTPLIVRVILGADYGETVPVLRILLLLLPILGLAIPLGNHWVIPIGLDSLLTKVTISGGILHVPIAIALGSQFHHVGIAWALVFTESYMLVMMMALLLIRGLGPFRLSVAPGRAEGGVSR